MLTIYQGEVKDVEVKVEKEEKVEKDEREVKWKWHVS